MRFQEIADAYRALSWRDFSGRAMRRLFDFAIPQVSYSQVGEDMIVDFLFQGLGIQPVYLELGTNHPKYGNNTYKFYRRGCRGVLVEADPSLIPWIRRVRRRDRVLHVGVGTEDGATRPFYVFENAAINTFDEQEARARLRAGTARGFREIPVAMATVNTLIEQQVRRTPDFLSIDIEGMDLQVLQTLDFARFPVPVICAETCRYSENHVKEKDPAIAALLEARGYFAYADTYVNTIFVNRAWFLAGGRRG